MAHLTWVGGGQGESGGSEEGRPGWDGGQWTKKVDFCCRIGSFLLPTPATPTYPFPSPLRCLLSHLPLIELNSSFLTTLFIKIKELNVLTVFFLFSQVFISGETKLSCWICVWPREDAPWQQCPPGPAPALGVLRGEMGHQSCL